MNFINLIYYQNIFQNLLSKYFSKTHYFMNSKYHHHLITSAQQVQTHLPSKQTLNPVQKKFAIAKLKSPLTGQRDEVKVSSKV